MALETLPWDPADSLKTPQDCAVYLNAALEEAGDDAAFIAEAIGTIARARGMESLARETGLTRQGLYKSLASDGNPSLSTLLKVLRALGLQLHAEPVGTQ
jgi:probable addiction module antidote protein